MNGKQRGFLLLTCHLGDPARKPLTVAQFRSLASRVSQMEQPKTARELTQEDLLSLGYDRGMAKRIVSLLLDADVLTKYLSKGQQQDCIPISRIHPEYPAAVRRRLGLDAPGCLWAKGDIELLQTQMISLVGSREPLDANRAFAQRVGGEAARQGITLVSGNARGSDRAAQQACLDCGGQVICVVADELTRYPLQKNVLYLSEDGFDLPFSAARALSRNRVIHALGYLSFIAQSDVGIGGTWDGTVKNLRHNWSPVFCFADGSAAATELEQLGATLISADMLSDFPALRADANGLL